MSRKPQITGSDPNQTKTKPVYIVPWEYHGYGYDGDGDREWAEMNECGYSLHQRLNRIVPFLQAYRTEHGEEFEREDFPHYRPVPRRDWWHGHDIPFYRLRLPLRHSFHQVAARDPDGVYLDRHIGRDDLAKIFTLEARPHPTTPKGLKLVIERECQSPDVKVGHIPFEVFWPERRNPDIW